MNKLAILFLGVCFWSTQNYAFEYYEEDREVYYSNQLNLLKAKEIILKKSILKKHNKNLINKKETFKLMKMVDNNIKYNKEEVAKNIQLFESYRKTNKNECDYEKVLSEFNLDNYFYHGLWHLNYINMKKVKPKESNVAIIDGYMSSNRLLPNLKIKNCLDSNNQTCNSGLDMLDKSSNNIYKNNGDHTYWVTSILGGSNCGNSNSGLKFMGVNPKANILIVNVSIYKNGENQHSLRRLIKAISELDKNDINIIYAPLAFINYSDVDYIDLQNAVNIFLEKPNRAIVGVIGNTSSVDINDIPLPCAIDKVICVGGVDRNGTIWSGGVNNEKYIDVYAPASNIIGGITKNKYRIQESGVSASGAIVAGMISNIILDKDYEMKINKIKKGGKIILNKDGTIKKGLKGASY